MYSHARTSEEKSLEIKKIKFLNMEFEENIRQGLKDGVGWRRILRVRMH